MLLTIFYFANGSPADTFLLSTELLHDVFFRMEHINIRAVTWNVAALEKPQNFSFVDLIDPQQTLNQQTVDLYVI